MNFPDGAGNFSSKKIGHRRIFNFWNFPGSTSIKISYIHLNTDLKLQYILLSGTIPLEYVTYFRNRQLLLKMNFLGGAGIFSSKKIGRR